MGQAPVPPLRAPKERKSAWTNPRYVCYAGVLQAGHAPDWQDLSDASVCLRDHAKEAPVTVSLASGRVSCSLSVSPSEVAGYDENACTSAFPYMPS